MLKNLISFYQKNLGLFLLFAIEIILFLANYKTGTYFLGWDNLFPEMNFPVNINRSLFSVWQEYRGLGLLDGMSFAANLPHYLFLWSVSWVLPQNLLRYFFFFLMHFLGGVGIYILLEKEIKVSKLSAFIGALFYQLNLASIQMFYAPYELFAVHFAFLPWLILFVRQFLKTGDKKSLFWLFLFSIIALPQAHVPTLFLVYIIAVGFILLFSYNFKRAAIIISTIFIVNAFWLLPYGYGVITGGARTVIEAKINQMSRFDIYANQKFRGDIIDVLSLQGFMLDMKESIGAHGSTDFIMAPWRNYIDTIPFKITAGLIMILAGLGLINILHRRDKSSYPFVVIFLIAFFFLGSNIPGLSFLNDLLRDKIPMIGEAFRFSFTKFAIIFALTMSVFLSRGVEFVLRRYRVLFLVLVVALLIYSIPSFSGQFLFDSTRISIPNEYFQTVNYFNHQPLDTRVALFPQSSYWSWRFTNFGYRGSGFFWYGIPQPTLDLAFDPWSRQNENYYWEISYALYSKNRPLFESVLEKYRVNWLLIDGNIINPSSPKALFVPELEDLINQSPKISLAAQFGQIKIYRVNLTLPTKDFVSVAQNLPNANSYQWGNLDQAFVDLGDYVASPDPIYPNRSLFTGKNQSNIEFNPEKLISGQPMIKILPDGQNAWTYPSLSHRQGYLIKVIAKNISGKPYLFWIENLNSRRADLETYLPASRQVTSYFVQPPMEQDGLGYTFHLDSISVGKTKAVNEFEEMDIYPIDYWGLVKARSNSSNLSSINYLSPIVDHPNPSLYRIDLNSSIPATIILAQSYDPGWVAIGAGNHVLIDNWANGWQVENGPRVIYLFFWPQLLEFAGFGLLTAWLGWVIIQSVSKRNPH